MFAQPNTDEYAPFYAEYVTRALEGDVMQRLQDQPAQFADLLSSMSEEQALARPAPGEWNIKEIIGHLNDTERVFSYRALRFSRGDATPLSSFDQGYYVQAADFSAHKLTNLLQEFEHLRAANVLLFQSFTPAMLLMWGVASDKPVTVRALVYITAGHADQHLESLRTVYLPAR